MNEEASAPYVDWEYDVITDDGAWNRGFRARRIKEELLLPGGGWHIEFRGRTGGDEMLLANYFPSDAQDAREWLNAFESWIAPPGAREY